MLSSHNFKYESPFKAKVSPSFCQRNKCLSTPERKVRRKSADMQAPKKDYHSLSHQNFAHKLEDGEFQLHGTLFEGTMLERQLKVRISRGHDSADYRIPNIPGARLPAVKVDSPDCLSKFHRSGEKPHGKMRLESSFMDACIEIEGAGDLLVETPVKSFKIKPPNAKVQFMCATATGVRFQSPDGVSEGVGLLDTYTENVQNNAVEAAPSRPKTVQSLSCRSPLDTVKKTMQFSSIRGPPASEKPSNLQANPRFKALRRHKSMEEIQSTAKIAETVVVEASAMTLSPCNESKPEFKQNIPKARRSQRLTSVKVEEEGCLNLGSSIAQATRRAKRIFPEQQSLRKNTCK
jgi:hypothetical protein